MSRNLTDPVDTTPDAPKSGLQADFQMWGYDFKRLNSILEAVTFGFLQMASQPEACLTVCYALKEFYSSIRFLLIDKTKAKYDKDFKDLFDFVKTELTSYHRHKDMGTDREFNLEVYVRLDRMRDELLEWRQIIGLGIPAQKKISKKFRLKGAMTGD